MKNKYHLLFRVKVSGGTPDFVFYAPNIEAAKFYTEMCGFEVVSVQNEN